MFSAYVELLATSGDGDQLQGRSCQMSNGVNTLYFSSAEGLCFESLDSAIEQDVRRHSIYLSCRKIIGSLLGTPRASR